jgi:hypothetical protein
VLGAISNPLKEFSKLWKFGKEQVEARLSTPEVPVHAAATLRDDAAELGKRVRDLGLAVTGLLRQYREAILERQYQLERIADAACDLYASSCTLARLDHVLTHGNHNPVESQRDLAAGRYFLKLANRRVKQNLAALWDNDDEASTAAAKAALERHQA